jgi:type II secretion system protein G
MKTNPRIHRPGFTLVELMSVIIIIVILAGMVMGGLGYVNERQARSKAQVQISLLSKALEEYKLDNGRYPPTGNITGLQRGPDGSSTSRILFNALYFDSNNDRIGVPGDTTQKIYVPELDPVTSKQLWTTGRATATTPITDPWGNQYCYRSAKNEQGNPNAATQNPDFDLWSMGKDGRSNPEGATAQQRRFNADDIYN